MKNPSSTSWRARYALGAAGSALVLLLSAGPVHAEPYLVYKVSCSRSINYWEVNVDKGRRDAGKLSTNQNAYIIQDTYNLTQVSVYVDLKRKTYFAGSVGEEGEFIDPYGTDPFFSTPEVVRTFFTDKKGKTTTFWSYSAQDDGEVFVTENGELYKPGGYPVFSTWKSAEQQTLQGQLAVLSLGNGDTYRAPSGMSGEGTRYLSDPQHAVYFYDTKGNPGNDYTPGVVENGGSLHIMEKRKISFSFQASLTKQLNTGGAFLDQDGTRVEPGTDRYALLKLYADLKKQKLVFAAP